MGSKVQGSPFKVDLTHLFLNRIWNFMKWRMTI